MENTTEKAKRLGNITIEQKTLMRNFMSSHPELVKGKFKENFTFKQGQDLWKKLTKQLNEMNGAEKDWMAWRKTWHDLCSNTKKKKSRILKHRNATGGGAPTSETLTPAEEELVSLIGVVPIEGHPETSESLVTNFFETNDKDEPVEMIEDHIVYTDTSRSSTSKTPTIDSKEMTSSHQKRQSAKRPLEHTISATAKFADQTERKLQIKENYYEKKLKLYEREVVAKKKYYLKKMESMQQNVHCKCIDSHK